MSWCRLASRCSAVPCALGDGCPGSDVYIYEHVDGFFHCCFCRLFPEADFRCDTKAEMFAHIAAHVAAGHHVNESLRLRAEAQDVDGFFG